jgi:hypothetical protein
MWWIVGVVAVIVVLATYLTWVASRVDRLQQRAAAGFAALDAALTRRAGAALTAAGALDRPDLADLARTAMDDAVEDRQGAENALTKAIRELPVPLDAPVLADLVTRSRRVSLTRHVYTDVVRDTRVMRRRRLVRVMRFGRRHPIPDYFDIEDPILVP